MSPTARTLKILKQLGTPAGVVERWIPQARKRIDLFGFCDIVALFVDPNYLGLCRITAIQVTSGSNHAARRTKLLAIPEARTWIQCGGSIQIRSWSKVGKRGKRKLWMERVEIIGEDNFK